MPRYCTRNMEGHRVQRTRLIKAVEWLRINIPFLFTYFSATIVLSLLHCQGCFESVYVNIAMGLLTSVVAPYIGFLVHMVAHLFNFKRELYDRFGESSNCVVRMYLKYLSYYLDFHNKIHHSSKLGKQWLYIVLEAIQNFQFQAMFFILLNVLVLRNVFNNSIIGLWGLLYVTMHLINFSLYKYNNHENHHKNRLTNFEPYIFDIIHGTTFEGADAETSKEPWHFAIVNVVILTALIVLVRKQKYI